MKRMLLGLAIVGSAAHFVEAAAINIDFSGLVNNDAVVDVVGGVVDTTQGGIDAAGSFGTVGAINLIPSGVGTGNLPNDGFFAADTSVNSPRPFDVQLQYGLNPGGNNTRNQAGGQFTISIPSNQGNFNRFDIFGTSSGGSATTTNAVGDARFIVTFTYTTGSPVVFGDVTNGLVIIDDQSNDGGALDPQPVNVTRYYLFDGGDQVVNDGSALTGFYADDLALFGLSFPVDPNRLLSSVLFDKQSGGQADWFVPTVVQVPEPASLSLLAVGGLMAVRRRRQA